MTGAEKVNLDVARLVAKVNTMKIANYCFASRGPRVSFIF